MYNSLLHLTMKYIVLHIFIEREIVHWQSRINGFWWEVKEFSGTSMGLVLAEIDLKKVNNDGWPSCDEQKRAFFRHYVAGPISLILQEINSLQKMKNEATNYLHLSRQGMNKALACPPLREELKNVTDDYCALPEDPREFRSIKEELENFGFRVSETSLESFDPCSKIRLALSVKPGKNVCKRVWELAHGEPRTKEEVEDWGEWWPMINKTFAEALESSSHRIWRIKNDYKYYEFKRLSDLERCSGR